MKTNIGIRVSDAMSALRRSAPTGISFQGSGVPTGGSPQRLRTGIPTSEPDSATALTV